MYFYPFHPLPPPVPGKLFENQNQRRPQDCVEIDDAKTSSPSPLTTAPPLRRPLSSAEGGARREAEFYCLKVRL